MPLHGDFWLADHLYKLQGSTWTLRWHPITESLIHIGGKWASTAVWLLVVGLYGWSHFGRGLVKWRRPLAYLAVTWILATAFVGLLKAATDMDCPWNLLRYGGDRAFVGFFEVRPPNMPHASCFPAGHASAGYAWFALYFFFLETRPRFRWTGLAVGVFAGATFGFGQQLRGAHFFSHDVWTAVICWLTALGGYLLYFKRPGEGFASPGGKDEASTAPSLRRGALQVTVGECCP